MKRIQIPNDILFPEIRRMIDEGLSVSLQVKGESMRPLIAGDRDSVTLSPVSRPLKKFDIVLARIAHGQYVLHRITKIGDNGITLMGDGNPKITEHCKSEDVIAIAESINRKGKTIRTDSRYMRIYAVIWNFAKPLRRYLLGIHRRL